MRRVHAIEQASRRRRGGRRDDSANSTQVGSCLAVPPPGIERDPSALLDALSKSCASVAFFAPSQLGAVLEVNESASLQSLRLIVCCGEALPPSVVTQCSTEAPQALLANVYGPTEADITYWEAPPPRGVGCVPPPIQQVPIGRAVDHVRVVVLNSDKDDVCALGVPGELAFIGDVAFGYLNNVEATAKAFSKAPAKLARNESDRMYRTGDVVRYSGNELRFLGRQDRQIKLRGLRIELGEIESKLNQIQGVKESVCTTNGTGAAMALIAYARCSLDGDSLRDQLASSLPKYMVPSQIICVSEFPRTDRGKLDTKKLPSVKCHASEKPSSELEASLSVIFAEVLGIDSVGVDDDFEALGGNSLLAGRATNLIRRRVEGASRIPGTTLYAHPTIRSLARVITEERARRVHDAPVPLVPDTTYHARDPTRCVSLLIQIVGVITVLGMRYMDWPAWYVLWYLYLWLPKVYVFACVPLFLALTDFGVFLFAWVVQRVLLGNNYRERCKRSTELWSLPHLKWWLVAQIQSIVTQRLERVLHGTRLMNTYYRALGASIGTDVILEGRLADPPLATIGDRCTIRAGAEVDGHAMCKGRLVRHSTKIGADSYIDLHAYVAPGTNVPANASVGALSTTDKVGSRVTTLNRPQDPFDAMERKRLLNRRTYLGIPIAYILQALPYIPFVYFLEWWFYFLLHERRGHLQWPKASWLFWFAYPWVWRIGFHEFYFWTVVIYKWVFIGRFSERRDEKPLRRWLLERLVEAEAFEHCLKPWVSTELLCWRYRFLGCKIGRRVHADFFRCVEFDLVTVEDDVVFGSLVRLAPRADTHLNGSAERIVVRREANVLDHALVLPGCVVGERAVLGTFSLGAARQVFQPGSVATGNKKGQAVVLRKRPELPSGTTPLALLEAEARRRHKSLRWTLLWNTVNILVAAILYPLRDVFEVCIISCGYMLYFYLSWDGYYAYLGCLPLLSAVTALLHCVLIVLLKKVIIGKFARGDHAFYSRYHFCWALMMTLLAPVYPLIEAMHGTVLAVWFYRAMGASIGHRACVHGKALEFDLLQVADGASIGRLCDTTCHTVENMVIKLADVSIGKASDVGARSVVMPGASLGDGASLLPHSLVLKGEAAPAGSTYAGLPAEAVSLDAAPNADADASAPLLV